MQEFTEFNTLSDWVWVPTLTWSPDGRYLIFVTQGEKESELWRVEAKGGDPEKVGLRVKGSMALLCVHPDGQQIAYKNLEDRYQVWVVENLLTSADPIQQ